MKHEFAGVNGKRCMIDMSKAEMVEEVEADETHIHTSSDWFKVREPYDKVVAAWQGT